MGHEGRETSRGAETRRELARGRAELHRHTKIGGDEKELLLQLEKELEGRLTEVKRKLVKYRRK